MMMPSGVWSRLYLEDVVGSSKANTHTALNKGSVLEDFMVTLRRRFRKSKQLLHGSLLKVTT